jgi:cytochrome P450
VLIGTTGVPRLFATDYQSHSYSSPKGAVVLILDLAMSKDPKRYIDPSVYNPGR